MTLDAWRLAVGTLSAWPVRPPRTVDRDVAGRAMLLAPLAVLPLAVAATLLVLVADAAGLAPLVTGLLVVALLALGTRAFHLDGLADTADGLTSSYERERTLAVMRSGDVGPAGAAALVLVLGLQAAGVAALAASDAALLVWTALLVGSGLLVDVPWWRTLVAAGVAVVVLALLLLRARRRLGGVTGDVLGAGVELTLAAVLVVLS